MSSSAVVRALRRRINFFVVPQLLKSIAGLLETSSLSLG